MLTRIYLIAAILLPVLSAAQDDVPLEEHILGVWRMELRTLESPGVMYYQEAGTVTIIEQMPDGTFRVMSRVTTRAVAESDDLLVRPGCLGKKECVYDEATEGVGVLMDDQIYIDWLDDEGWIDDLLTIDGNVMTGDDGNGPIRLVKESSD
jgi:hypothetical protein